MLFRSFVERIDDLQQLARKVTILPLEVVVRNITTGSICKRLRLTQMHVKTLREVPSEAEIPSHVLLLRTGMIRKLVSGVYGFMPMGWRSIRKIENIVREEMDASDCIKIRI